MLTYDAFREDWWFSCQSGRHFISSQLDVDDNGDFYYVGIYLDD